jgi:hypothetical protein
VSRGPPPASNSPGYKPSLFSCVGNLAARYIGLIALAENKQERDRVVSAIQLPNNAQATRSPTRLIIASEALLPHAVAEPGYGYAQSTVVAFVNDVATGPNPYTRISNFPTRFPDVII